MCSAKIVKRSAGRSSTGAAAYRAAMEIEDERTGLTHDYERRGGVLHSEIMAPENTPAWMRDRVGLWNAVEAVERRHDAQLAREFILGLPHELSTAENVGLVREFVQREFVDRGMIADVNVHSADRAAPDQRNVHAHVMLTMRAITADGFGNKERAWNDRGLLQHWREEWARHVNRALERGGHDARVDHRSLKAQGIDREPQPKLGPVATQMEREGRDSHAGNDVRAVQERNERRDELKRDAEIINLELARLQRQGRAVETPKGAAVIAGLDAIDRHDQRQIERQSAAATVRQAETHCRRLERREAFAEQKDAALAQRFERVFRDGGKAQERFQATVDRDGWRRAVWTLRTHTKEIGTLKGWGFLGWRSGARQQAEREFWKLVKEAGRTEGLKAKVAAEAPDRDTARAWVEEAKRRQGEEHARPDPARKDLQIALAETARGLSNADYSALTTAERFMLKDAREVAKAARLERGGEEMKSRPGASHLEPAPPTQGEIEARWERERAAAIPAGNRPKEPNHPPHLRPDGTPKNMCWVGKESGNPQLAYIADVQEYMGKLEAGVVVGPFPGREPKSPAPAHLRPEPAPEPRHGEPRPLERLHEADYAKAMKGIQAEDRAAARAGAPPERADAPARQDTAAKPERPSEALNRAAAPPSRDEAFERRLAEIRAQRAEERERNRERGRDMGRTR